MTYRKPNVSSQLHRRNNTVIKLNQIVRVTSWVKARAVD